MRRNEFRDSSFSDSKSKKFRFRWWFIPLALVLIVAIVILVNTLSSISNGNKISSVSISKLPDKLVYYVGEKFSPTGLEITTTYNNGNSFTEGPEACQFSGFNSEFAVEEQQIFVTYGEHSFVYTVTIKEPVRPFSPLKSIALESLPKTEYKVGDWLSVDGGVLVLTYEDGHTRRIPLEYGHIYGFSTERPVQGLTVTVKYREDSYLATCTYTINVSR